MFGKIIDEDGRRIIDVGDGKTVIIEYPNGTGLMRFYKINKDGAKSMPLEIDKDMLKALMMEADALQLEEELSNED